MFYLINLLLIIVYYLIIKNTNRIKPEKSKKVFAILVGCHAILFRALANPFNYVDTEGYASAYEDLAEMSWIEFLFYSKEWGVGYVFINWVLGHISSDYTLLFVFMSIISVGPVVWFYYKTSHDMLLTMLFFLMYPMMYYMGFGVIRQHVAVAFVLLALYYSHSIKISLPLVLVACSFHTSAILVLPFYIWQKVNIQNKGFAAYVFLLVGGLLVIRFTAPMILSQLSSNRYDEALAVGDNNNIVPVLYLGSMVLMFYLNGFSNKQMSIQEKNIVSFIMYGVIIALFSTGMEHLGRTTLYYMYVLPTSFTLLSKYNRNLSTINNIYVMLAFLLLIIQLYLSYSPEKYVYTFFWEKNYLF